MPPTVSLSVRVEPDQDELLTRLSLATDRKKSWHIKKALDDYLTLQAWQVENIQEGREDARGGRVIPHDKVASWLGSWGTDEETPPPE